MSNEIHLILSSDRGVYIPQNFAEEYESYTGTWEGINLVDIVVLLKGPEHEWYWEAWNNVEMNAKFTHNDGTVYHLHLDGDVWLIPEGWEDTEEGQEFFGSSY